MSSEPERTSPGDNYESSGTAAARDDDLALDSHYSSNSSLSMTTEQPKTPTDGEEETLALESHEVIELQTFSERKDWIEEKIKVRIFSLRFYNIHQHVPVPRKDAAY